MQEVYKGGINKIYLIVAYLLTFNILVLLGSPMAAHAQESVKIVGYDTRTISRVLFPDYLEYFDYVDFRDSNHSSCDNVFEGTSDIGICALWQMQDATRYLGRDAEPVSTIGSYGDWFIGFLVPANAQNVPRDGSENIVRPIDEFFDEIEELNTTYVVAGNSSYRSELEQTFDMLDIQPNAWIGYTNHEDFLTEIRNMLHSDSGPDLIFTALSYERLEGFIENDLIYRVLGFDEALLDRAVEIFPGGTSPSSIVSDRFSDDLFLPTSRIYIVGRARAERGSSYERLITHLRRQHTRQLADWELDFDDYIIPVEFQQIQNPFAPQVDCPDCAGTAKSCYATAQRCAENCEDCDEESCCQSSSALELPPL